MSSKIWCGIVGVLLLVFGMGCALTDLFSIESPRPKEYQVKAAKEITTETVKEVMKGQTGKQTGIQSLAEKAIVEITKAKSQYQVAGITNIVANAANSIKDSDGSAELLSRLSGKASKGISEMSALEYMSYVGGQTALAMQNREKMAKGISAVTEWSKGAIGTLAGGISGGGGILALTLGLLSRGKKVKSKDSLLKVTGNTVNEFTTKYPTEGAILKAMLAKATANLPVNASSEFGTG